MRRPVVGIELLIACIRKLEHKNLLYSKEETLKEHNNVIINPLS